MNGILQEMETEYVPL